MEETIKNIYCYCKSNQIMTNMIHNMNDLLLKDHFDDETIRFLNIIVGLKHQNTLPSNKKLNTSEDMVCNGFLNDSLSKHYCNFIKLTQNIFGRSYPFKELAIECLKSSAFVLSELSNCELFEQFSQINPIKSSLLHFCENIHLTLNVDTRKVENYELIEKSITNLEESHNALIPLLPKWVQLIHSLIHCEYSEEILNMDKYEDAIDLFNSMVSVNENSINLDIISISLIISDNLYEHCPNLIIMQRIKEIYTDRHTFLKNHYLARPNGYLYNRAKDRFYDNKN